MVNVSENVSLRLNQKTGKYCRASFPILTIIIQLIAKDNIGGGMTKTVMQCQLALTAYLKSTSQLLLLFGFARQRE